MPDHTKASGEREAEPAPGVAMMKRVLAATGICPICSHKSAAFPFPPQSGGQQSDSSPAAEPSPSAEHEPELLRAARDVLRSTNFDGGEMGRTEFEGKTLVDPDGAAEQRLIALDDAVRLCDALSVGSVQRELDAARWSTCCHAGFHIEGDPTEGTCFYVCDECGNGCDIGAVDAGEPSDPWHIVGALLYAAEGDSTISTADGYRDTPLGHALSEAKTALAARQAENGAGNE